MLLTDGIYGKSHCNSLLQWLFCVDILIFIPIMAESVYSPSSYSNNLLVHPFTFIDKNVMVS